MTDNHSKGKQKLKQKKPGKVELIAKSELNFFHEEE